MLSPMVEQLFGRRITAVIAPCIIGFASISAAIYGYHAMQTAHQYHQVARAAVIIRAELNHVWAIRNAVDNDQPSNLAELTEAEQTIDDQLDLALSEVPALEQQVIRSTTEDFVSSVTSLIRSNNTSADDAAANRPDDTAALLYNNLRITYTNLQSRSEIRADDYVSNAIRGLIMAAVVAISTVAVTATFETRNRAKMVWMQASALADARYRRIIEHSPIHIYLMDEDENITFASPAAERMLGSPPTKLDDILDHLRPQDRQKVRDIIQSPDSADQPLLVKAPVVNEWFETSVADHRDDPAIGGLILTGRDITHQVGLQDRLRQQAYGDFLTGLPNRRALEAELSKPITNDEVATCLLLIDLDGFKGINDTLGHAVGDALLREVANRLRSEARVTDKPARLGGDEFAVVINTVVSGAQEAAERTATRVLDALCKPYDIDGQRLNVNASIGTATAADSEQREKLFRYADIALYEAKHAGGKRWRSFEPRMEQYLLTQARIERDMRIGVDDGQFRLVYQPLVAVPTGEISGFEALMRWESPTMGTIPPSTFVPVAEQSGLIVPLGRWALRTAMTQLSCWQAESGNDQLYVAVNASMAELTEPGYAQYLHGLLTEIDIDPGTFHVEVTESLLADDTDLIIRVLEEIRSFGVRVALDDFGTGYSSMSQLRALPVDSLKIDREFVQGMDNDERARSMVHALVELGRALDLTVVAEGIEEIDQLIALCRHPQCDIAQGFLLARPTEASAIPRILRDGIDSPLVAEVFRNLDSSDSGQRDRPRT